MVPEKPRPDIDGDFLFRPIKSATPCTAIVSSRASSRRDSPPGHGPRGRTKSSACRDERTRPSSASSATARAVTSCCRTNRAFSSKIVIPPGDELTPELLAKHGPPPHRGRPAPHLAELDGAVVNVELTRFPRGGVAPAGRVIEVLGRPGEFGVDVEILIRKHHLPHRFPEEVLEQAPQRRASGGRSRASKAAAIFAICRSSPSTAKPRAISTMPSTSSAARRLAPASAYRRRRSLRRAKFRAGPRGAPPWHVRLFSRPRRAHAAGGAFERHLLAASRTKIAW